MARKIIPHLRIEYRAEVRVAKLVLELDQMLYIRLKNTKAKVNYLSLALLVGWPQARLFYQKRNEYFYVFWVA